MYFIFYPNQPQVKLKEPNIQWGAKTEGTIAFKNFRTPTFLSIIMLAVYFLLFRELRTKISNQILLNFCAALSLMLIVFLVSANLPKTSPIFGCRAVAVALHYFLLAAFLWMAVEGFNMYLSFVKVFHHSSHSKFMLKCCLLAWGTSY